MYIQGACCHRVPGKEYRSTILNKLRYERKIEKRVYWQFNVLDYKYEIVDDDMRIEKASGSAIVEF